MESSSPALTEALRRTLSKLGQLHGSDDPKVIEITRRALLRLAVAQQPAERRRLKMLLVQCHAEDESDSVEESVRS